MASKTSPLKAAVVTAELDNNFSSLTLLPDEAVAFCSLFLFLFSIYKTLLSFSFVIDIAKSGNISRFSHSVLYYVSFDIFLNIKFHLLVI